MYLNFLKRIQIGKRKGVITTTVIPANVPICEITGDIITIDKLSTINKSEDALQIGPDVYLCPTGQITDYIRHSCNPNCMIHTIGNRVILYSMYVIKANSEVTFDYSTSSTEGLDSWKMECNCGSFNCRKIISGFYHLEDKLQEEYKTKGIAALFIREPIFLRK